MFGFMNMGNNIASNVVNGQQPQRQKSGGLFDTSVGDPMFGRGAIGQGGAGAMKGMAIGSQIAPGYGTVIGGIAGGLLGNIQGLQNGKLVDGGIIGNIFGNF